MSRVVTDYLSDVFHRDRYQGMVKRAIKKATEIMMDHPFEAIAFTGTSGSAIGYVLGYALDVPLICIRKDTEKAHYKSWDNDREKRFEGYAGARTFLIVDDFISSGATVERLLRDIHDRLDDCRCAAMLMYQQSERKKTWLVKNEEIARKYRNGIPVYSCRKDDCDWSADGF